MNASTCLPCPFLSLLLSPPVHARSLPPPALSFEVAGITVTPHNRAPRTRSTPTPKTRRGAG